MMAGPSEPMLIPTRRSLDRHEMSMKMLSSNKEKGPPASRSLAEDGHRHRSGTIPPAVAALLAVTSIPPMRTSVTSRSRPARRRVAGHRPVITVLDEVAIRDDVVSSTLTTSPWEILLTPSDEVAADELSHTSQSSSMSPESVPSLEGDDVSQASLSGLSPPESDEKKSGACRKEKPMSSAPVEDCLLDHPLLTRHRSAERLASSSNNSSLSSPSSPAGSSHDPRPSTPSRSSGLRSNLTASLRVVRSAAKSFSNLTAGSTAAQADDFLTRSILYISPQFTDEKWPAAPVHATTPPALRQYLKPPFTTAGLEDSEIRSWNGQHLHHSTLQGDEPCTGAIQLQTYPRPSSASSSTSLVRAASPRSSKSPSITSRVSSPPHPILVSSPSASSSSPSSSFTRTREPRENNDFLRMIVLETNMRRAGKLSDSSPGKARFVLPPRKTLDGGNKDAVSSTTRLRSRTQDENDGRKTRTRKGRGESDGGAFAVPARWVGVTVRY